MPSIINLTFKCTILLGKHHYLKLVTAFLFCASKSLIPGLSIMPLFILIIHASLLISFWNQNGAFYYKSSSLLFILMHGSQILNIIGAICYLHVCFDVGGNPLFAVKNEGKMGVGSQSRSLKIVPVLGQNKFDFHAQQTALHLGCIWGTLHTK